MISLRFLVSFANRVFFGERETHREPEEAERNANAPCERTSR